MWIPIGPFNGPNGYRRSLTHDLRHFRGLEVPALEPGPHSDVPYHVHRTEEVYQPRCLYVP